MSNLTTDELAQALAGGDSYIRTKNNVVKGLAITTDLNPEAPDIVVVGNGPRIISNAKLYLEQQQYVPVYVKQSTNNWKYLGHYKADKYSQDPAIIEKHRKNRSYDEVDGILFLSSKDKVQVEISSPSLPDVDTRKKIEIAAIEFVASHYSKSGYLITDRQKDNCGYDLLIENETETFKVEVKGTASSEQHFYISRNERAISADPLWRLAIVTNALSEPNLVIVNTTQMEKLFTFDALCWECKTVISEND